MNVFWNVLWSTQNTHKNIQDWKANMLSLKVKINFCGFMYVMLVNIIVLYGVLMINCKHTRQEKYLFDAVLLRSGFDGWTKHGPAIIVP